ncbi:hypothetical protein TM48_01871 [Mycobacterium shottsii]|nr:hypothetical protein TM48_01871 [Mycobacterium shottsii]
MPAITGIEPVFTRGSAMGARTTCPARTAVTADSSVAVGTAVAAPAAGAASTTGPAFDADGAAAAVTAVAPVAATGRANPVKAGGTCNRAAPSGATLAPSTRIATSPTIAASQPRARRGIGTTAAITGHAPAPAVASVITGALEAIGVAARLRMTCVATGAAGPTVAAGTANPAGTAVHVYADVPGQAGGAGTTIPAGTAGLAREASLTGEQT